MTGSSPNADRDSADEPDRATDDEARQEPDEDAVGRDVSAFVIDRRPFPVISGPDHIDELSVVDEDPLTVARPGGLAWLTPTADDREQLKAGGSNLTQASETGAPADTSGLVAFYSANFDRISRKLGELFRGDLDHAEDITQQAFETALDQWPRIAAMRNPYGYIAKIAWNLAMKWFRAQSREEKAAGLAATACREAPTLDQLDLKLDLARAVSELPEHERTPTGLSLMGYTPKEIAEILEVPPATVRSRLMRARARLKAALKDSEGGSKA